MLAECKVEIESARALILETARKRDRGEDVTMDVSLCKYLSTEMCFRVADRVVQIFGGRGYAKYRGIERFSETFARLAFMRERVRSIFSISESAFLHDLASEAGSGSGPMTGVDHIILAVADLETATEHYACLLGMAPSWQAGIPATARRMPYFCSITPTLNCLRWTARGRAPSRSAGP